MPRRSPPSGRRPSSRPSTNARSDGAGGLRWSPWRTRHSRSFGFSSGLYFASQSTWSHSARAASALRLAVLVWHGPLSRARKTSRLVAAWRASSASRYRAKPAESCRAQTTSTRPRPNTSTLPKTVSRRFVPAAGSVGWTPRRCQTRVRYGFVSAWVSSSACSSYRSGSAATFFPRLRQRGSAGGDLVGVLEVLERMLGPAAHEVPPRQQHPQPARRDPDPGRPRQVRAQAVRGPHSERQVEARRRGLDGRLQGLQIGPVGLDRSSRPWRVGQRRDPTVAVPPQPQPHRRQRPLDPLRDPRDTLPQRRRLDHLQPLAHPWLQLSPAQPRLPLPTLALRPRHDLLQQPHGSTPPPLEPSLARNLPAPT